MVQSVQVHSGASGLRPGMPANRAGSVNAPPIHELFSTDRESFARLGPSILRQVACGCKVSVETVLPIQCTGHG